MAERKAVTMQVTARVRLLDERGAVMGCWTEEARVVAGGRPLPCAPTELQKLAAAGVQAMMPQPRSKAKGQAAKAEEPAGGEE